MANNIAGVYVEMDLPYCDLDFGVPPCEGTGVPCFNTRNLSHDCSDPANYTQIVKTVRFAMPNGYDFWPQDGIETLPILASANSSSAEINPAEDMGMRAQFRFTLNNCLSSMVYFDKNIIAASREDDFYRGTFLGKFKSRFPYLQSLPVRVYRGYVGGVFAVEHYIVDSFSGPDNGSGMSFSCVDFLKLTSGKKSQFPPPTTGKLLADIDGVVTSLTLEPAGIGDLQYPASGKIAVGKEGMSFIRVGDDFTVVRNLYGVVEDHRAGDQVQLIGEYSSETSADIIYDLLVNYTELDASFIDKPSWDTEISSYQSALYSAQIAKPEAVSTLINEIIEQAGLIFYADVITKKVILKVLRPVVGTVTIDNNFIVGFKQGEQQNKRVSQVWTYFNQRNPLEKLDDPFNYYSALISPSAENLYGTEVIKKIYSRWIPDFAASVALDLNSRLLQRYVNPPREFSFSLFRDFPVTLGQGALISHRSLENAFGDMDTRPTYITKLNYGQLNNSIKAQEFVFKEYTGEGGGGNVVLTIDADSTNLNLKRLYDTVYSSLTGVVSVKVIVKSGTFIGGANTTSTALTIGDFGAIIPELEIEAGAFIVGAGGSGATIGAVDNGGDAIDADFPVVINNLGVIGGGGGAGGGGQIKAVFKIGNNTNTISSANSPGAAGAGYKDAQGVMIPLISVSAQGKRETGQTVAEARALFLSGGVDLEIALMGDGGDLGQAGLPGSATAGGAPGRAIIGNSNITWTTMGDIRGAII